MARPTKLTPERRQMIVEAIRAGNYAETACRAAGIAEATFYRWLSRGAVEQRGAYFEFARAVRQAEAEAEQAAVELVRAHMPDDWRAAVAFLERRFSARWRRRTSTEISGPDGGPIETQARSTIDLSLLTDADLQVLEEMNQRVRAPAPDSDRS